jgi:hypothetical protein
MTSPLTPQQLADVAREVTGIDYAAAANKSGNICAYNAHGYVNSFWMPECNATQWQVLVEWLADRIEKLPAGHRRFSMMDGFLIAINKRDTTALQRMVIELKGAAQ